MARKSHLTLTGPGEWETVLKPLESKDIQSLAAPEDDGIGTHREGLGEGHRTLSWIWISAGTTSLDDAPDMHKGKSLLFPR